MLSLYLASALLLGLASSHGDPAKELSARSQFLAMHTNNLNHCAKRHQEAGLDERAIQRRAKIVRDLTGNDMFHGRHERLRRYGFGIMVPVLTMFLQSNGRHRVWTKAISQTRSTTLRLIQPSFLAASQVAFSALRPLRVRFVSLSSNAWLFSTVLPSQDRTRLISMYAVVDGEAIRSQLIDDQVGVPVYLDIQVIDVNTCEPVKDIFLEMWSELPSLLLQMRDIAMECP